MNTKFLATVALSALSLGALAMPASTDSLIRALISSGQISKIVDDKSNISEVKITRADKDDADFPVESSCSPDVKSRDASVLEVLVTTNAGTPQESASVNWFVTKESPTDLHICAGIGR